MKQIAILIAIICIAIASHAQRPKAATKVVDPYTLQAPRDTVQKPKMLILQGDLAAFEALVSALDESEGSHKKVEALKKWIIDQVRPQLEAPAAPRK